MTCRAGTLTQGAVLGGVKLKIHWQRRQEAHAGPALCLCHQTDGRPVHLCASGKNAGL